MKKSRVNVFNSEVRGVKENTWIDVRTKRVRIEYSLYNFQADRILNVDINVIFNGAGTIEVENSVATLP